MQCEWEVWAVGVLGVDDACGREAEEEGRLCDLHRRRLEAETLKRLTPREGSGTKGRDHVKRVAKTAVGLLNASAAGLTVADNWDAIVEVLQRIINTIVLSERDDTSTRVGAALLALQRSKAADD